MQASGILFDGGALVYLKLLMSTTLSELGAAKADADTFAKELTEYTEPEDLAKVCASVSAVCCTLSLCCVRGGLRL